MSYLSVAQDFLGNFVTVGRSGVIYTYDVASTTPEWVQQASPTTEDLHSVAWGYDPSTATQRWIAVGANGTIITSPTGVSWTLKDSPVAGNLNGVAYGGTWLVVGDGGLFMASTSILAEHWKFVSSGVLVNLNTISVDLGTYVITGAGDTVIVGVISSVNTDSFFRETVSAVDSASVIGPLDVDATEPAMVVDGLQVSHYDSATMVTTDYGGTIQMFIADNFRALDVFSASNVELNGVLLDGPGLYTWLIGNGVYQHTVAANASITATIDSLTAILVVEQLLVSATVTAPFAVSVMEALTAASTASTTGTFNFTVLQGLSIRDRLILAWATTLAETITTSGVTTGSFEFSEALTEAVSLLGALSTAGSSYTVSSTEAVQVGDIIAIAWAVLNDETITATSGAVGSFQRLQVVAERLAMTGAVGSLYEAYVTVATSITFDDAALRYWGRDVADSVTALETASSSLHAVALSLANLAVTEVLDNQAKFITPAAETLGLTPDASAAAIFQSMVAEGISFLMNFGLFDYSFTGRVINAENFAASEYPDYAFNTMAKIGDSYYGASETGLYVLEGDDDAGTDIDASLKTGKIAFNDVLSRVPAAHLAIRTTGEMLLKVQLDDDKEYWYKLLETDWTIRDKRVKLGLGLKSMYWQFTLENVDGGDFELDSLTLMPILLQRRSS